MFGSETAHFPNPRYICEDCGRDLGDRYSRLKGNKTPCANIIKGKVYCDRCANKHYDD